MTSSTDFASGHISVMIGRRNFVFGQYFLLILKLQPSKYNSVTNATDPFNEPLGFCLNLEVKAHYFSKFLIWEL